MHITIQHNLNLAFYLNAALLKFKNIKKLGKYYKSNYKQKTNQKILSKTLTLIKLGSNWLPAKYLQKFQEEIKKIKTNKHNPDKLINFKHVEQTLKIFERVTKEYLNKYKHEFSNAYKSY